MFHKNAFGQLQLKKSRIQARILEDCEHTVQKVLVSELHRGDIHRHGSQGQACIHPDPGLLAGFTKNPVADRQNKAAVFRDGNKLRRRNRPSNGMRPTQQCFRAGNLLLSSD